MKRHLVRVVQDCTPITKVFKSKLSANKFIKKFSKKYSGRQYDGYWIDLVAYDVEGEIIDDGELIG